MGRIKETTIDDKYIGNIDQRMYGEEVIVMSSEIIQRKMLPKYIEVRGAKVHNLKNIDVNIPLHEIVAIAGVARCMQRDPAGIWNLSRLIRAGG